MADINEVKQALLDAAAKTISHPPLTLDQARTAESLAFAYITLDQVKDAPAAGDA